MSTPDYENMTDDELMALTEPTEGSVELGSSDEDDTPAAAETPDTVSEESLFDDADTSTMEEQLTASDAAEESVGSSEEEDTSEEKDPEDGEEEETPNAATDSEAEASDDSEASEDQTQNAEQASEKESKANQSKAEAPASESDTEIDYKAAYEQIMAPFKANGKKIQARTPEEVISLMQHGANYTKKMHALAPNLKMMRMLENNGLLEEAKINELIDLANKNPEAIAKLVKDAKIDPLDLDTSAESTYQPKNHAVSDQEMEFHTILEDVLSAPSGNETISVINSTWDPTSKEAIYKEPQIMQIIHDQRANGVYDRISAEVDRRKTLGTLPSSTPFIQAYKQVGDELFAQTQAVPTNSGNQAQSRVIETRTSSPRKAVSNGDKAKAASPARAVSKPSPKPFDPFSLSDEEIMAMPTQFS